MLDGCGDRTKLEGLLSMMKNRLGNFTCQTTTPVTGGQSPPHLDSLTHRDKSTETNRSCLFRFHHGPATETMKLLVLDLLLEESECLFPVPGYSVSDLFHHLRVGTESNGCLQVFFLPGAKAESPGGQHGGRI